MNAVDTPEEFFEGLPAGLQLYRAVAEVVASLGPTEVRVTRSQIAFRTRRKSFAFVWRPGQYLKTNVAAVLSFGLGRKLRSPRFKEVARIGDSMWMHHLELRDPSQIDGEVRGWLEAAYEGAQ